MSDELKKQEQQVYKINKAKIFFKSTIIALLIVAVTLLVAGLIMDIHFQ